MSFTWNGGSRERIMLPNANFCHPQTSSRRFGGASAENDSLVFKREQILNIPNLPPTPANASTLVPGGRWASQSDGGSDVRLS